MNRNNDRLGCLDKASITELSSFHNPPAAVKQLIEALYMMLGEGLLEDSWRKFMTENKLLEKLVRFNTNTISYKT